MEEDSELQGDGKEAGREASHGSEEGAEEADAAEDQEIAHDEDPDAQVSVQDPSLCVWQTATTV